MVSLIEAVILSLVQGITEWLPVSSSGHLALIQEIFGFQNLAYDVFLHFASIFAIIVIFFWDIIGIFRVKNLKYLFLLIIGLIPAAIVGFIFQNEIASLFSNLFYLGLFFIFSGIVVYSTKFSMESKNNLNFFDSLFIGLFQAIAILPGISRSGMTISSGLFRGLTKRASIKFSFLMAIPIILGASLFQLENLILSEINYYLLVISFMITFFISLLTIKLLIKIINSNNFYLFGIYNLILGVIILIWSLM